MLFCVFPSIFWTPGHLFLDCVFSVVWFPAVSEHYHQSHNDHYDCEDYEDYYQSTVNTVTLSFYVFENSFILGGGWDKTKTVDIKVCSALDIYTFKTFGITLSSLIRILAVNDAVLMTLYDNLKMYGLNSYIYRLLTENVSDEGESEHGIDAGHDEHNVVRCWGRVIFLMQPAQYFATNWACRHWTPWQLAAVAESTLLFNIYKVILSLLRSRRPLRSTCSSHDPFSSLTPSSRMGCSTLQLVEHVCLVCLGMRVKIRQSAHRSNDGEN